jgi:hypothetical protein
MKPWDKVSSFWDANTLFQGQQNKGRTDRSENTERRRREIKGATRDQIRGAPRIRAEEPRLLRDTT